MSKSGKILFIIMLAFTIQLGVNTYAEVLHDFEIDDDGWTIPSWAFEKEDYGCSDLEVSQDFASTGKQSLKMMCDFPGKTWKGGICEVMERLDLTPYHTIACDVYVPADAPQGLTAKIILTVGNEWAWTEMNRSVKLEPGKWTTVQADLYPGSKDWPVKPLTHAFRTDIRKIDIRVESNNKPVYKGPVYFDNVRAE